MQRERYEQDRGREGRGGQGRRRGRGRDEGGSGQRTRQRFEDVERFRERLRGPGSWAGLQGDYGQEQDEPIGYEEPRDFAGGRFEDDRGEPRDEDFGYYGGQGRGSRRSTAGSYYEEPGFSGPGQRNRFGDRGEFGSGEDWQQPRYLSGSYDQAAGRGFGSSEQEQAWVAGGGAERWGGGGQQQRGGPHVGKGPKGYQRSDERILEDVCETLERHPRIDASEIEVTCSQGEITLRGSVDSRQTRRLAEEAVEDLPGVRDVRNELRAQSQMQHGVSETGGGRLEGNRGRS